MWVKMKWTKRGHLFGTRSRKNQRRRWVSIFNKKLTYIHLREKNTISKRRQEYQQGNEKRKNLE
jgi:hypothetical protein